jgi:hypothetical protein
MTVVPVIHYVIIVWRTGTSRAVIRFDGPIYDNHDSEVKHIISLLCDVSGSLFG